MPGSTRPHAAAATRLPAVSAAAAVAALALVLVAGCSTAPAAPTPLRAGVGDALPTQVPARARGPYAVVHVVDGDTVRVSGHGRVETLRLIGIDTPETRDPRRPVQCFGAQASARAHRLLDGRRVSVELDASQGTYDRYGRTLAYLWLPGHPAVLVNEVMVRDGFAHEDTYDQPYRYQAAFRAAERDARTHGRGLWSAATCGGDTTQPAAQPSHEGVVIPLWMVDAG